MAEFAAALKEKPGRMDATGLVEIATTLAASLAENVHSILDVNDDFLLGCLPPDANITLDELSIEDVSKISEAALEINSIEAMLEFEKNLPTTNLAMILANRLASYAQAPSPGTSGSSVHLYDPASQPNG